MGAEEEEENRCGENVTYKSGGAPPHPHPHSPAPELQGAITALYLKDCIIHPV